MAYLVASSANAGLGVASTTCAVTVPATSPDTLLVLFIAANSFAVSSIAMGGGVWTQALNGSNNSNFVKAWEGRNVAPGTTSGTITFGGSTASGVQSMEFGGLTSVVGTNVPGFATGTAVSAGPTTPAWGQNVVLGMMVSNTGGVSGPSGGFTGLTPLVWTGTRNMAAAYLIQTQPSPATIGWTITSGAWDAVEAAFQAYEVIAYVPIFTKLTGPLPLRRLKSRVRLPSNGVVAAAATTASAEVATGTGTATDPSIQIAPNAGQATGTGVANAPTASVKPTSGVSTATGVANAPALSLGPTSQTATGTGTANAPTGGVQPAAGSASGVGAANAPAGAVQPGAGQATAIGAANTPAAQVSGTSGLATGSGVAGAPSAGVTALGGIATGTATAFDPTVILQGSVTAFAEVATASVTAFDPTGIISDRRGHAGLSRYTRLGQQMPPKPLEVEYIPMAVIAYAGVARGYATAFSPSTSWNDDESTIELLMGI